MNYTEKYHLPQWEETDRIMRTDFNEAMATIEESLTDRKDGETELRSEAWRRLCRTAYNHYCAVSKMEPFPRQLGVFYQDPAADGAGVTGIITVDGTALAGNNQADVTSANFKNYIERLSSLTVVKGDLTACVPLEVRLNLPGPARLRKFSLSGSYSDSTGALDPYRAYLIDETTGETLREADSNPSPSGGGGVGVRASFPIDCFLHAGTNYLLRVEPLAAVYNGTFELADPDINGYTSQSVVTAARILKESEGSHGGMLILRCEIGGAGGTLEMKWDGKTVEPSCTRTFRYKNGRTVQEFIYLRGDDIPAETSFEMKFTCHKKGDILFYDWGAILL